ncbi:hypothetical protein PLICRDRAFT_37138 [Plicaturopsis crispa FD-325 SS-3]|nr:hypothetical protein PLICRDRAFT_37138 [Plicaturopsis crispa FD-325 SS-3]
MSDIQCFGHVNIDRLVLSLPLPPHSTCRPPVVADTSVGQSIKVNLPRPSQGGEVFLRADQGQVPCCWFSPISEGTSTQTYGRTFVPLALTARSHLQWGSSRC